MCISLDLIIKQNNYMLRAPRELAPQRYSLSYLALNSATLNFNLLSVFSFFS